MLYGNGDGCECLYENYNVLRNTTGSGNSECNRHHVANVYPGLRWYHYGNNRWRYQSNYLIVKSLVDAIAGEYLYRCLCGNSLCNYCFRCERLYGEHEHNLIDTKRSNTGGSRGYERKL